MSGAQGVVALVMLEWVAGLVAASAWTQTWKVVQRGHFRIVAWTGLVLAGFAWIAVRAGDADATAAMLAAVTAGLTAAYLLMQYARGEMGAIGAGAAAALAGAIALGVVSTDLPWPRGMAWLQLAAGAALLGGVTNGMLLGHWYLNQPGLKPWALGRLTAVTLGAVAASLVLGLVAGRRLASAATDGAVLGLPGFGESFGFAFYGAWLVLAVFTGAVVWMARRCVSLRSIQSATGLYYVALLTAGVSEFVLRYLMVNA